MAAVPNLERIVNLDIPPRGVPGCSIVVLGKLSMLLSVASDSSTDGVKSGESFSYFVQVECNSL